MMCLWKDLTKYLGVIIDENLTWKNHIDAISKPIFKILGCFLNVFDTLKLELGVVCTSTKQIYFHKLFPIILLNIIKSISIQQDILKIIIFLKPKKKKKFSNRSIQITGPIIWNSLDTKIKHCKTT